MESGFIERAIENVGQQFGSVVDSLVPLGTAVTGSFIILGFVFLGVSVMFSLGGLVPGLMRVTGASALTLWSIQHWGDIVRSTLRATRQILGLFIPGYSGPTALFSMAIDLFGRLELEYVSWDWSAGFASNAGAIVGAAIAPILVLVGLSFTGILAVVAELQFLVGAAAAPLVLPALAFSVTVPLGWGPVYFMVKAGVRVVVMGLTAFVMAQAISAVISAPGTDAMLTNAAIAELILLAILCLVVGLYVNGVANDLVGGGAGSLGLGAVSMTASAIGGMASGGAAAIGAVAAPAASAAGGAMSGGGGALKGAVGRSSGRGNAFN